MKTVLTLYIINFQVFYQFIFIDHRVNTGETGLHDYSN